MTSSQMSDAMAWIHFPGQSSASAVCVIDPRRPKTTNRPKLVRDADVTLIQTLCYAGHIQSRRNSVIVIVKYEVWNAGRNCHMLIPCNTYLGNTNTLILPGSAMPG